MTVFSPRSDDRRLDRSYPPYPWSQLDVGTRLAVRRRGRLTVSLQLLDLGLHAGQLLPQLCHVGGRHREQLLQGRDLSGSRVELLLRLTRALGKGLLKKLDVALETADASVEPALARAHLYARHVLRHRGNRGRDHQDGESCNLQRDLASHGEPHELQSPPATTPATLSRVEFRSNSFACQEAVLSTSRSALLFPHLAPDDHAELAWASCNGAADRDAPNDDCATKAGRLGDAMPGRSSGCAWLQTA